MPVSTASCIFFTMPIFSTLFASLILKESFTKLDAAQLMVAFCGVLVINNPFDGGKSRNSNFTQQDLFTGSCIALWGAVATGSVAICMRYMNKGIHFAISPFWYSCGCAIFGPMYHSFLISQSESYIDRKTTEYDTYTIFLIIFAAIASSFG